MAGIATLRAIVLDCPHPRALAEFYRDSWAARSHGTNVELGDRDHAGLADPRPPAATLAPGRLTGARHLPAPTLRLLDDVQLAVAFPSPRDQRLDPLT